MYPWLCGPPVPGKSGIGQGAPAPPRPRAPVRMRTHCLGNILHGVRPQPAPFQSKGRGLRRAHSQAGLTQGRGMKGEGTAAQVALLWSQDPGSRVFGGPCVSTSPQLYWWATQGPEGTRAFLSYRSSIQSTGRFYSLRGKTKGSKCNSQVETLYSSRHTFPSTVSKSSKNKKPERKV